MADRDGVIAQMQQQGLTGLSASELVVDGNIHRFRPDWEPSRKKERAWYVLFEFVTDRGEHLISGAFGWWKGAQNYSFTVSVKPSKKLSAKEQDRLRKEAALTAKLADQERVKRYSEAAERAASIWDKLPDAGGSDYLTRKKVKAYRLRFSRGSIVVPVTDLEGSLYGLQFIDAQGGKKFLTGTAKKGHFHMLGSPRPKNFIAIAEGYATAASVHMATSWPAVVAFDAGNLLPVAKVIRKAFPEARLIICGDDDTGKEFNTGRVKALEAAEMVNGMAVFTPDDPALAA